MQKSHLPGPPPSQTKPFVATCSEATTLRLVSYSSYCLRLLEVVFSSTVEPSGFTRGIMAATNHLNQCCRVSFVLSAP